MTARRKATRGPRPAERADLGELLTLPEVLATLRVAKSTFFRWRALGKAPQMIKYPNGSLMIDPRDLAAWIADHKEDAAA